MARDVLLPCVKTYDIRGKVPEDLDEGIAERIGRAYVAHFGARKVVVGRDVRDSGPALTQALIRGLCAQGADVIDLGMIGTEVMYFGAFSLEAEGVDGGIVVTASHNPMGYNGMKLVTKGAVPVSGDSGLYDIERLAHARDFPAPTRTGGVTTRDITASYVEHLLGYVDKGSLRPLKVVTNPGHGAAGPFLDAVAAHLPLELIRIHHAPDGTFPAGVPNPLEEHNRAPTIAAVQQHGADLGLAWDGDFDRCFFFDETGAFVDGYYVVGLFAGLMLEGQPPGTKIIHDPRLTWNTVDVVQQHGGTPVACKTGHAFIKERMRQEDAVYGGEMSAHHYFRRFAYCDSGMIPWLLMAGLLSQDDRPLSAHIADMKARYPISGEINRHTEHKDEAIALVEQTYGKGATVSHLDGLSLEHDTWRLSLRKSNTEPVLRLNLETRQDPALLARMTEDVLALIDGLGQ